MRLHYQPEGTTFLLNGNPAELGMTYRLEGSQDWRVYVGSVSTGFYGHTAVLIQGDLEKQRVNLQGFERCFELNPNLPLDPAGETLRRRIRAANMPVLIVADDGPGCVCKRMRTAQAIKEYATEAQIQQGKGWAIAYQEMTEGLRWLNAIFTFLNADVAGLLKELSTNYYEVTILPA